MQASALQRLAKHYMLANALQAMPLLSKQCIALLMPHALHGQCIAHAVHEHWQCCSMEQCIALLRPLRGQWHAKH